MQDFNEFANSDKRSENGGDLNSDIFNLINSLSGKFDGKSQNELMRAVYEEAKRGKKNGTLKNSDIDNFVSMLSPILDDEKRKMLYKIANELKKI
ncbi:MAG: hypothetical protein IJC72_03340 [Clostridia bacterium]|nr:hypothetical protein [Clostridia bacterium]